MILRDLELWFKRRVDMEQRFKNDGEGEGAVLLLPALESVCGQSIKLLLNCDTGFSVKQVQPIRDLASP